MPDNILERIDRLKQELDEFRPLPEDVIARVEQKLRIEANYHTNAIEGNSLTLGETRSLILHGLTAHGKPMRDHLDIEGHNDAVEAVEFAIKEGQGLNETFIRGLHKVLLKEPYEVRAITPDGTPTTRRITIGQYKTAPNNVQTRTGEIYHFLPPEQVQPAMTDLVGRLRRQEADGEHPIIIAASFHYEFVRIHPFDDGNGRMARLLMNLILVKHGYTIAMVRRDTRDEYLDGLETADRTEDRGQFIRYIASCCEYPLNLFLKAARGEAIDDPEDVDREIALFKRSLVNGDHTKNQIDLRHHVEHVVLPFKGYCTSKIESLVAEISTEVLGGLLHVSGLGTDAKHFTTQVRSVSEVPRKASAVSIRLRYSYIGFFGFDATLDVTVANSPHERVWEFSVVHSPLATDRFFVRCDSDDQDYLKMTFNRVLRHIMEIVRRWNSQLNT